MATYTTEIQTGGSTGPWRQDAPLTLQISNREDVIPASGDAAAGTVVTWSHSSRGAASITFNDAGSAFSGTAQFPNEGGVGYRGKLKQ